MLCKVGPFLFGRLDQAEHYCTADGSLRCIGEQKVLSVNDEGLDTSFRTVVGDFQSAIFQIIGRVEPILLLSGYLFFQK